MRKPLIAANWKLNKTVGEAQAFFNELVPLVREVRDVEIVVAPPFTALSSSAAIVGGTNVKLAAQDVFYEDKGAYTGEVSPAMLTDVGCEYVIIGHSERRQYFHETDEILNKKIKASRNHKLKVIFCIGESLEERESGRTFDVLKREVTEGLRDVPAEGLVVAYEPIWAIGTGKTATPEQAQEVHNFIRGLLTPLYGNSADDIRILYGGSMTPDNVSSLMACADVDGGLVGGASLKADSFSKIVKFEKT